MHLFCRVVVAITEDTEWMALRYSTGHMVEVGQGFGVNRRAPSPPPLCNQRLPKITTLYK